MEFFSTFIAKYEFSPTSHIVTTFFSLSPKLTRETPFHICSLQVLVKRSTLFQNQYSLYFNRFYIVSSEEYLFKSLYSLQVNPSCQGSLQLMQKVLVQAVQVNFGLNSLQSNSKINWQSGVGHWR